MAADPALVIVGAGQAGGRAALALRAAGHAGAITLVGAERAAPYERPPLSKAVLLGRRDLASCTFASAAALEAAGVAFLAGQAAVAIDRPGRSVLLDSGRRLAYDKLLLATGRAPRRLDLPPELDPFVHVLRDLDDAHRLRAVLVPGARLAVIGGGFIGLEVAASARALGVAVTVLEALPRLLARGVPALLARRLAERHAAQGVALRLGRRLAELAPGRSGVRLRLDDGAVVEADAVLVGIGAQARTALAEEAGLAVDDGILVDATLRTSDPDIFAAGDVTATLDPATGRRHRLESWQNAERQGALAATNLLGGTATETGWPWYWSEQHDLTLQLAGDPLRGARTVDRPLAEGGSLHFHLAADGQVVGVSALGPPASAKEFKLARLLAEHGPAVDPAALGDPATSLKALLR